MWSWLPLSTDIVQSPQQHTRPYPLMLLLPMASTQVAELVQSAGKVAVAEVCSLVVGRHEVPHQPHLSRRWHRVTSYETCECCSTHKSARNTSWTVDGFHYIFLSPKIGCRTDICHVRMRMVYL
jgi:hypothetical protein